MNDLTGREIRGYELHELIGLGGFGAVYRATQTVVGREVVIKIILPQYASQPEFIRRFEAEAKLVARLEHLHIVSLYDYWRDPSGAYLVMRLLRGGSLRDSLRSDGPWSLRASARLLSQMGSALQVAHRANVIHRDVKPANILLDEDKNSYLTDFGIAVDLVEGDDGKSDSSSRGSKQSSGGSVTGSAGYISPEQINLKPVTARSDIYSMSVLMYELLTGQHPYADAKSAIALFIKHTNEPLPEMEGFPAQIQEVLQKGAAKDPEERYPNIIEMAKAFRIAIEGVEDPLVKEGGLLEDFDTSAFDLTATTNVEDVDNPYKGLQAFQEGDAEDFHGRESLIEQLLSRMDEDDEFARFLAVVGPSGSGKSSVVKAGLVPALRDGKLPGSDEWFIVEMVPGDNPLEELEDAISRVAVNPLTDLKQALQDKPLVDIVNAALPSDDSELVLVIDQFEEAFTQTEDESVRNQFLQGLYQACVDSMSRLRVVITLRADFYDRPLMIPNFSALIQQRTEVVVPLTVDELERAITAPARAHKVFFQQGLAAQIVSEVNEQPGVLPMLQYALTELFDRRDGQLMTTDAYQEIGGVLGALARRAEEIYVELDDEHQAATRQLFLRLVTLGEGTEDTRRRALQSEILSAAPNAQVMQEVIDEYGRYRLLTFDRDPATRTPTAEVAHEALIREWQRLRDWLDTSRSDVRLQRLLANAAGEWNDSNHDPSFLLRGGRLLQFDDWSKTTTIAMTDIEQEYLKASIEERTRAEALEAERLEKERQLERRNRNRAYLIMGILAIGFVVSGFLGFSAVNASQDAINNAATATFALGDAEVQANNAQTQAAIALNAQSTSDANAQVALDANSTSVANAEIAETSAADAINAQGTSVANADVAATSASDALNAQSTSDANADVAATNEADAINAQGTSIANAEVALNAQSTSMANAEIAETSAADALNAQSTSVANAEIAETSAADALNAQSTSDANAQVALNAQSTSVANAEIAETSAADALNAQSTSVANEIAAQQEAEISRSLVLASSAIQLASSNSPLALRLALEANDIDDPSLEAQRALLDVVFNAPRLNYQSDRGGINGLAMTTDGLQVFTANSDGSISLWDIEQQLLLQDFVGGHEEAVNQVAVNPSNANQFASVGENGEVVLWDVATGEITAEFVDGHTGAVNTVAFDRSGAALITGGQDGNTQVWNLNGTIRTTLEDANPVNHVSASPTTADIAIAGDNGVRVWNPNTTGVYFFSDDRLRIDRYRYASFSADAGLVLTSGGAVSQEPELWEWDTVRQTLTITYPTHNGVVNFVTFSPNGQFVLSASDDFELILSNASDGSEIRRFVGHSNRVTSAVFSPDSTTILSAAADGEMFLWDTSPSGEERRFTDSPQSIGDVEYLDDGLILSSSDDGTLRVYNPDTGDVERELLIARPTIPQTTIAIASTGNMLDDLTVLWASTDIRLVDGVTGEVQQRITLDNPQAWIEDIAISDDEQYALGGGGFFFRETSSDFFRAPALTLWDLTTGDIVQEYTAEEFAPVEGRQQAVTAVAILSATEDAPLRVVAGVETGTVYMWEALTGTFIREFSGHSGRVRDIQFSDNGQNILTGSDDRTVLLWEVDNGSLIRRFSGHTGAVSTVAFNDFNDQVLSGSFDTRIILWDVDSGQPVRTFSGQDSPVTSVQFTPTNNGAISGAVNGSLLQWGIGNTEGLITWAQENRYIPELTCSQREQYRIEPLCEGTAAADSGL